MVIIDDIIIQDSKYLSNNNYKKKLFSYLDNFIKLSNDKNVLLYGLTINHPIFHDIDFDFENKEHIELLENNIYFMFNIFTKIPLLSFIYFAPELSKGSKAHYHVIIGIKSILGYNPQIKTNLYTNLVTELEIYDTKIDFLDGFINIKNYFLYCIKDSNAAYIDKCLHFKHKFYIYDNFYDKIFEKIINTITEADLKITCLKVISKWTNVNGFSIINNSFSEYSVINLINFFMLYKNYYFYKDWVYKQIDYTILSVEKKWPLEDLINNIDIIYNELKDEFWLQLENLDLYELKIRYFSKIEILLNRSSQFLINKVVMRFDIMEFSDGIYFLKVDKFIKKEYFIKNKLDAKSISQVTTRYYDKTYKHLTLPTNWLKCIVGTVEKEKLNRFYQYFASIFNKNDNKLGKKRIAYIHGPASTGKTLLTARVIMNYYGVENVGFLSKNKNFSLEDLIGKEVGIFDEFEHYKMDSDVLLKLLEKNPQIADRKYQGSKLIEYLSAILLSNNEIKLKDPLVQDALEKRIELFKFTKVLPSDTKSQVTLLKQLEREEPNIIVYCNKIFFKELVYEKSTPKIRNTTIIRDLLEL